MFLLNEQVHIILRVFFFVSCAVVDLDLHAEIAGRSGHAFLGGWVLVVSHSKKYLLPINTQVIYGFGNHRDGSHADVRGTLLQPR